MRGVKRDWAGVVQGNLTVIADVGKNKHGARLWKCRCVCGDEVFKSTNALNGGISHCGLKCSGPTGGAARTKHGLYATKEYRLWQGIIQRCTNPSSQHYARYGGRGIQVAVRWQRSFETFLGDVGFAPSTAHTLDRVDNDKGYTPRNVRWATRKEQANNRSTNLFDVVHGVPYTLAEIAVMYGVRYHVVTQRYRRGLRGEELIQPKMKSGRKPKERP
jgi:hypothetical protein